MSVATYSHARLDRPIIPKGSTPRKVMKAPDHDIYLRREHIAREKTNLIVKPYGGALSKTDYKVTYEAGGLLFSVSGREYNEDRKCREVRDSSGLPMFDVHRKPGFHLFSWIITLPGSKVGEGTIGKATSCGLGGGSMELWLKNGEREERLTVIKHGHVMTFFDVFQGAAFSGGRIAEFRESTLHSQKLALRSSSRRKTRPAWDVNITPGVDMALMSALGVILSEWYFKTD
ncbi:tubby C-terminal-like domain-containing protein [Aspergillus ambiguus]|uniref:tubby C-terminal-like domain-containing protein n=1 Tax=Aspergillus ambiguus TaxID=176160 RepID=UPI003CCD118A